MPKLVASETSPYARKVRIVVDVLGLWDSIPLQPANTRDPDGPIREINPLGKIPALLLDDGSRLFDSRVIVDYLETVHGDGRIISRDPHQRFRQLTSAALAEGITDALLLITYEGRFREPDQASQQWLDHQYAKITRGLDYITTHLDEYAPPAIASITLACALGYADWRKQIDWRALYPGLVTWLDEFAQAVPSWQRTMA